MTQQTETCRTCLKPANAPFRRFHRMTGEILDGCIDNFHSGHLPAMSNTSAWHNRPEAKRLRAEVAKAHKEALWNR